MSKVILDMAMSLDGYISGPNGEDAGLYDWYFDPNIHPASEAVKNEGIAAFKAIIMGKRAYGSGFDDTPYDAMHFVVTHEPPRTLAHGPVRFTFVNSIHDAIDQARIAADDGDVAIGGGADIAQQCLAAGVVDEIQIHLVPKILGRGKSLFDADLPPIELRATRIVEGHAVTHLKHEIANSQGSGPARGKELE